MADAGTVAVSAGAAHRQVALANQRLVRRRALLAGSFLFWLYGMSFMFLLPRLLPKPVSDNPVVQSVLDDLQTHEGIFLRLKQEVKASKNFLWWASASKRQRVGALQDRLEQVEYRLNVRRDVARDALVQEGHGLWSHTGLEDTRRLFWETFQTGRRAARDNSILDSVYHLLGGFFQAWTGDTDGRAAAVLMVARLIVVLLWNYTAGCIISAVIFMWRLPAVIKPYQPTVADAAIFFLSSTVAALSVLTTFLALLVATIFCCLYSTAATVDALTPPSYPLLTAPRAPPVAPLPAPPSPTEPAASLVEPQSERRPDSPLIPLEPDVAAGLD